MTAANKTPKVQQRFRLPDPPQREPDEMTQYDTLFKHGDSHALAVHLGNPESTLVEADRWIVAGPEENKARARRPDLLVAFGVDPELYRASNGYVVSEQGKAPDLVLEVASESTGEADVLEKREEYAALGILEYWRFDETGEHHGTKLAGDRLAGGRYEPLEIEVLAGGVLQGYSRALNLNLRWEEGRLVFRDPATGAPIATLESERRDRLAAEDRAETAEVHVETERQSRVQAEARASSERELRIQAEARNRELEEELNRLRESR
ncbi:MAG: Uma2 family endonuclease [Chloroflexota bacterium]|nr:Uma2 family endonuclease [Chloroflexota bacterium]MDE2683009.1 Uma2 family endonuclease [Chloroflexota bacterium]